MNRIVNDVNSLNSLHIDSKIKEPLLGLYMGGGEITVDTQDILKEPSKIPDYKETFEINCECTDGLKCKGHVWQW